ncbi:MAG: NUMOD4 domain-containing protein [Bacteroidales bacterium]|nr:NUMOD4 domain-containing protein [Bacteroidales bacterium]
MENKYWNEQWKDVIFEGSISDNEIYKISNYGRIKSFKVNKEEGIVIKPNLFNGYYRISLIQKSKKRTARYIHKLVAETFIPKNNEDQKYVIHRDYDKTNNRTYNLAWATKKEKEDHQFSNPIYKNKIKRTYAKLDESRVRLIKKLINDPNRKTRMKMIAKRFGISEMQLYRIKSGENWGTVK